MDASELVQMPRNKLILYPVTSLMSCDKNTP